MVLDPAVADQLTLGAIGGYQHGQNRLTTIGDNLVQGLGVIHNLTIQTNAGTTDDAATMAALRTSIHVPTKAG